MQTSSDPTGNAEDEIAAAREDAEERSKLHALHEQWHRFMDEVEVVARRHFSPDDDAAYVVAGQFGGVEGLSAGPDCFVSSNVATEALPMVMQAINEHIEQFVLQEARRAGVVSVMDSAQVPQQVREEAEAMAERMGLDPSQIEYLTPAGDERVYTDGEPELDSEGTPVVDVPADQVEGLVTGPADEQ